MRAKSVTPARPPQELDEKEWKFGDVPSNELALCFHYEYAREQAKQTKAIGRVLIEMQTALAPQTRNLKFLMLGHDGLLDALGASQEARAAIPLLWLDYFPVRPWQDIKEGWDAHVRAFPHDLNDKWGHLPCNKLSLHLFGEEGFSSGYTAEKMKEIDKIFSARSPEYQKTREFGFFGIEWETPDSVLKAAFAEWLALRREMRKEAGLPAAHKALTGRGRFGDKLRRLGASRYLDHYGAKEVGNRLDSGLRGSMPYWNLNQYYVAGKKVRAELGRLFPSHAVKEASKAPKTPSVARR